MSTRPDGPTEHAYGAGGLSSDAPAYPPEFPPPRPLGWYQAVDGAWYQTDTPPGPEWWLAADQRWYPGPAPSIAPPPDVAVAGDDDSGLGVGTPPPDAPWRHQRWGLGDFGWGMLVYFVGSFVVGIVVAAFVLSGDDSADSDTLDIGVWGVTIALGANFAAFGLVPIVASYRKGQRSLRRDFGLWFKWIDIPIGIGAAVVTLVVGGLLGSIVDNALGAEEDTSNLPVDEVSGWLQFVVFLLGVGIITPIIEELFFRGLFFRSLLKRTVPIAAIVICALVFMSLHLFAVPEWPGIATIFVVLSVYGLTLTTTCYLTKLRLGAPIVAHMIINSLSVTVNFWPG